LEELLKAKVDLSYRDRPRDLNQNQIIEDVKPGVTRYLKNRLEYREIIFFSTRNDF